MKRNPELYKKYQEEVLDNTKNMLKICGYISIIVMLLFGIIDFLFEYKNFKLFISMRAAVTLYFLLYIIFLNKLKNKSIYYLGISCFYVVVVSIIVMILTTETNKITYYEGMTLVVLAMCLFVPWETKYTVIACTLIFITYFVSSILFDKTWDAKMIFRFNFYLMAVIAFAIVSSYITNKIRLNIFKSRYELAESNKKLEKIKEDLIEANKNKDLFMANISHELRTPITLMLGPLGPIINDKHGNVPVKVKEILETLNKNGLKLLRLINNLLDLSKLESGKMRLMFKKVEIVEFCRSILDTVIPTAEERGLTLVFWHTPPSAEIMIDPDQFDKVLINLLSNAVKFTPSGGRVSFNIDEDETHVIFTVEDTGVGIPEHMREKIFDRFSQVDSTSSRQYDGTGIGLSLVKEIVELHMGSVCVSSEPGKGSCFTVKMLKGDGHITNEIIERRRNVVPITYKKRETDHEEVKISEIVQNHRELQLIDLDRGELPKLGDTPVGDHEYTILVIDDNADMLKLMNFLLKDEYGLIFALTAEEGIRAMAESGPDLVVCDVMMPGMDGYDFCRHVKSDDRLKHIPIMLVTALAEPAKLVEGVDSGADDYLPKPFNVMELKARIRSLLRLRKTEAALARMNENFKIRTDDLVERQKSLFHSLIRSLIIAIEAKDNYTSNHSHKVTEYSLAIAHNMGFTDREKKELELAAILHDVGKIAVPDSILQKSESLSTEDRELIKIHPVKGEGIVKHIIELKEIAAIVRSHHERYDGTGYPDGLSKHDIPIGARIMAVADAYDAMTSNRPYRKSLSHNFAVKEILKNSGKQFDPEVVEHFLQLADQFMTIKDGKADN